MLTTLLIILAIVRLLLRVQINNSQRRRFIKYLFRFCTMIILLEIDLIAK